MVADVAAAGMATALILRDQRGAPGELRYLPPGSAQPDRLPRSLQPFWRVADPDLGRTFNTTWRRHTE